MTYEETVEWLAKNVEMSWILYNDEEISAIMLTSKIYDIDTEIVVDAVYARIREIFKDEEDGPSK